MAVRHVQGIMKRRLECPHSSTAKPSQRYGILDGSRLFRRRGRTLSVQRLSPQAGGGKANADLGPVTLAAAQGQSAAVALGQGLGQGNPTPTPLSGSRTRGSAMRPNGTNIWRISLAAIPMPVSATMASIPPSREFLAVMVMRPPGGGKATALSRRLWKICFTRSASPASRGRSLSIRNSTPSSAERAAGPNSDLHVRRAELRSTPERFTSRLPSARRARSRSAANTRSNSAGRGGGVVAEPLPPQTRACGITALGSSPHRFAQGVLP